MNDQPDTNNTTDCKHEWAGDAFGVNVRCKLCGALGPFNQTTDGLFKVVWTDGYNREHIAEHAVAENLTEVEAECRCAWLRAGNCSESDWWIVKPQDAKLWRGIEEFV